MTRAGQQASDFSLVGDDDKTYTLSQYRGQTVVLAFYRNDDTPTCNRQLAEYNGFYDELRKSNIEMFGISPNTPQSHFAFGCRLELNFRLLSDVDKEVAGAYKVLNLITGYGRAVFVVNPDGTVKDVLRPAIGGLLTYPSVDAIRNALARN